MKIPFSEVSAMFLIKTSRYDSEQAHLQCCTAWSSCLKHVAHQNVLYGPLIDLLLITKCVPQHNWKFYFIVCLSICLWIYFTVILVNNTSLWVGTEQIFLEQV